MTWLQFVDKHNEGIGALIGGCLFLIFLCVMMWSDRK